MIQFPDAMDAAQSLHDRLVRGLLLQCGGYEIATEGDSFICSFPTPIYAVTFSMSLHKALEEADWPKEVSKHCKRY